MLGIAEAGPDLQFRFDSSKPMGKSVANNPAHALNSKELLIHLQMEEDEEKRSLVDLWETICEQIQGALANESDDSIFRILIPNFESFLPASPSR